MSSAESTPATTVRFAGLTLRDIVFILVGVALTSTDAFNENPEWIYPLLSLV